jgi:DNA-binding transcriptional ArsR family regulator
VATVFEVVAEPRRRVILDALRGGDRTVSELVALVGTSQPAVSKHLRVLREAGLVSSRVDAQRRVYRVDPAPLRALDDWIAPYRAFWADRLDALERHLDTLPATHAPGRDDAGTGPAGRRPA